MLAGSEEEARWEGQVVTEKAVDRESLRRAVNSLVGNFRACMAKLDRGESADKERKLVAMDLETLDAIANPKPHYSEEAP